MASTFFFSSADRSYPSEAMFCASSSEFSSKEMQRPGSPYSRAPQQRYFIANSVLPDPAPPQTSVFLPEGIPPRVISSKPSVPVGVFLTNSCWGRRLSAVFIRGLPLFFIVFSLAHRPRLESRNHESFLRTAPLGGCAASWQLFMGAH